MVTLSKSQHKRTVSFLDLANRFIILFLNLILQKVLTLKSFGGYLQLRGVGSKQISRPCQTTRKVAFYFFLTFFFVTSSQEYDHASSFASFRLKDPLKAITSIKNLFLSSGVFPDTLKHVLNFYSLGNHYIAIHFSPRKFINTIFFLHKNFTSRNYGYVNSEIIVWSQTNLYNRRR